MERAEMIEYITNIIGETNHGNEYIGDVFVGILYGDILDWLCRNSASELREYLGFIKYRENLEGQSDETLNSIIKVIQEVNKRNGN